MQETLRQALEQLRMRLVYLNSQYYESKKEPPAALVQRYKSKAKAQLAARVATTARLQECRKAIKIIEKLLAELIQQGKNRQTIICPECKNVAWETPLPYDLTIQLLPGLVECRHCRKLLNIKKDGVATLHNPCRECGAPLINVNRPLVKVGGETTQMYICSNQSYILAKCEFPIEGGALIFNGKDRLILKDGRITTDIPLG